MLSSTRRAFLTSVAAVAPGTRAGLSVPRRIQAFCVDCIWRRRRPKKHVACCEGIGAKTIFAEPWDNSLPLPVAALARYFPGLPMTSVSPRQGAK